MKKEYIKPDVKAIEINTESAIVTASGGPGLKSDNPLEYYGYDYD